ncbi:hypothetical protein MKW92_049320 [Papaver armeniacum]|nr:hypothetical protein MKW92_049320 [Papaver armeniacum]
MAITRIFSGSFLVLFLLAITRISVVEMTAAVQRSTAVESMSLKGQEACNPNDLYTDVLWAPTSDCTVYCTNWCRDACVSKFSSTMVNNKCTVANNSVHCDCCCKNNLPPPPPPPPPPSPPPPSPPPPSPPPPSPPPPSPPPPSPSPPPPSPPPPSPPPPCPSPPEPCSCCGCCNTDINIQISVTQGGNVKLSTPSSSSVAGHNRL